MKVKYIGTRTVELWNGRQCNEGDVVDVTAAQHKELIVRDDWVASENKSTGKASKKGKSK